MKSIVKLRVSRFKKIISLVLIILFSVWRSQINVLLLKEKLPAEKNRRIKLYINLLWTRENLTREKYAWSINYTLHYLSYKY